MKKRLIGTIAVLAAAGLALAGCSADPLGGDAAAETGGAGSSELTPLSLVVAPIHFEPAYIADREGYFEEEGLDVEIIRGADPTSNIARAVSGEVDITTGSLGTLITSAAAGVPIVTIAGNGYTSPDNPTSGIITLASSDIETPADLAGRTVGIQGLNTGSEIPMFLAAEDFGIDPLSIERVELASTGMETALSEGTIDAVLASAPYYQQLMARDDVHLVSNPSTEYMAGTPVTLWAATKQWVSDNEDTAAAFVRAMEKAQAFYEDPANVDAILDITAEISEVDRASLTAQALIPVSVAIDEAQAGVQAKAFSTYGIVQKPVTIEEILWSGTPLR
ncbi:ABC transporter substrate-binding protein [Leucobacter rhizosphaerae]|uniref:ABC transporter substrate-binding protein n=1 Tax=Leucobacter rhizosphaerae TaxID=2932245 RepID=A0ABY4FS20_9MICO|nr:ABC transporter substrate-binding protein [Leucobacter rhizosphaerae]UOQ59080.1 ABC transporter substrate-binding protein [Leucobacter rhizosphaerae]